MKDYFFKKFKQDTVEFTREYINEKDIWYTLAVGLKGEQLKCRMHNNNRGIWKIMGNRIPIIFLKFEEDFNEAILKNERIN